MFKSKFELNFLKCCEDGNEIELKKMLEEKKYDKLFKPSFDKNISILRAFEKGNMNIVFILLGYNCVKEKIRVLNQKTLYRIYVQNNINLRIKFDIIYDYIDMLSKNVSEIPETRMKKEYKEIKIIHSKKLREKRINFKDKYVKRNFHGQVTPYESYVNEFLDNIIKELGLSYIFNKKNRVIKN